MKFTRNMLTLGLVAGLAVPLIAADDPADPAKQDVNVQVEQKEKPGLDRKDQAATRKVQQGAKMGAYRSDDVLGMAVKNAEGKDMGDIKDVVVAAHDGKVRYAAISFGGFLGFGEKLFAIPWDALRMKKTDDSVHFVLNVTEEKLENAPGFDADNWPDFANAELTGKIDEYYREKDAPQLERQPRNPDAVDPRNADPAARDAAYRVSVIKDMAIQSGEDKEIASVKDVVIDIDEGKIRYVAVAFDDSWGYGEKLFAVPLKALKFHHQDDQTHLVLNVTQAQMKTASGFDQDDWPNFADREWQQKTDTFYIDAPARDNGQRQRLEDQREPQPRDRN